MNIEDLTIAILTKNEQKNIYNCLKSLTKFKKILVFDSYSTDRTRQICQKFKNVKIILTSKNMDYVKKKNYILKIVKTGFVLILDADYILSKNFYKEIERTHIKKNFGYSFDIYNKVYDKVLFEKLYPSKLLFFNIKNNLFKIDGHKEKLIFSGKIKKFKSYIIHEDQKNFKTWLSNQEKYAQVESVKIVNAQFKNLSLPDKIRRLIFFMNIISLIYYFLIKKLYKYGISGILYILQRQIYEFKLSIRIFALVFFKKFFNYLR